MHIWQRWGRGRPEGADWWGGSWRPKIWESTRVFRGRLELYHFLFLRFSLSLSRVSPKIWESTLVQPLDEREAWCGQLSRKKWGSHFRGLQSFTTLSCLSSISYCISSQYLNQNKFSKRYKGRWRLLSKTVLGQKYHDGSFFSSISSRFIHFFFILHPDQENLNKNI